MICQSRHHRQAPRRVGHEFQVDQRRLNRRVSQPAGQVIDGDAVHQQVAGVAVAQRMSPDSLPRRDRAQFLSAFHRRLHPAPECRVSRRTDFTFYQAYYSPIDENIERRKVNIEFV